MNGAAIVAQKSILGKRKRVNSWAMQALKAVLGEEIAFAMFDNTDTTIQATVSIPLQYKS